MNWLNFITKLCSLLYLFSKMCFVFYTLTFDDFMTFEYLSICCLLDMQNKLAEM